MTVDFWLEFIFFRYYARVILNGVKELRCSKDNLFLVLTKVPHLLKGRISGWQWIFDWNLFFSGTMHVSSWTEWRNFVVLKSICFLFGEGPSSAEGQDFGMSVNFWLEFIFFRYYARVILNGVKELRCSKDNLFLVWRSSLTCWRADFCLSAGRQGLNSLLIDFIFFSYIGAC
jgi:hypothetical protein